MWDGWGLNTFTSRFVNFIHFTSSKTHFFTLAINIYNIPHIPFFILQYNLLKYYKIIIFFNLFPPTSTTQNPTHSLQNHTGNPYPRRQPITTLFFPHAGNPYPRYFSPNLYHTKHNEHTKSNPQPGKPHRQPIPTLFFPHAGNP
jgi:hypothetical protein